MNFKDDKIAWFKEWKFSFLILPFAIFLIINKGQFIFIIDYINLLFHEGGHGIFKIFGGFLHALGGTLMQIFIPSLFAYFFFSNNKRWGVQISIVYLAQNLMNIAVYAADARAKKLPLLGGNKVYHDWAYLLRETGLLEYDKLIGNLFYFSAVLILIIALLMPLILKDRKTVKLDLKL